MLQARSLTYSGIYLLILITAMFRKCSLERLKRINENVAMDIAPRMKICRIGGITAGVFIAIMLI